ncbi:LutC/YkgG family protein [Runella slithyformis]|uniref:Lactate utilization protein B/C n=1 Tax=Runella slithyformis (strain ATCC 29530 / DSM 19594 / LMG 11500 / NCIMB 11436 / LSU 4) TaxID=761193 RepID=A0A7U4E6T7_RUNSL|nr:LUD domain-containing protein [Runella slithyformis]AEI49499.1 Lactate utilization protein B/C [Runella slithyformis DSM 19594]
MSREKILAAVAKNKPALTPLPEIQNFGNPYTDLAEQFKSVLTTIGGEVVNVNDWEEIKTYLQTHFAGRRIVTNVPALVNVAQESWINSDPHALEDVGLAILEGLFGVAENGSVWVTETEMGQRVTPFIAETLALVVKKTGLLPKMHDAYVRIGQEPYGFGAFIAGPSKTADIEQSLVLGAHGPKSMLAFLMD